MLSCLLALEPPLGAIHGLARVSDAPSQAARGVRHWFAGLGHVQDEDALTSYAPLLYVRGDIDRLVDALAEPVNIQLGSQDRAGAVLDAVDEGAASRRVRHAGDLVGELGGGMGVLRASRLEIRAVAPSGLLLEVDGGGLIGPRDGAVPL